jgi:hypothetical protein
MFMAVGPCARAQTFDQDSPTGVAVAATVDATKEPGDATAAAAPATGAPANEAPANDRIFGVLPNYSTVERDAKAPGLSTAQMFRVVGLSSFDPYVFPYVAAMVGFGQGGNGTYARRYATAMADNSIGNVMTSALFPTLIHQDPRYYARGRGSIWSRAGYALSRSVVTRSSSGRPEFNASEMAGNFSAAVISNIYYPSADRSPGGTLARFGSQVMADTLANELKEFWPDLRRVISSRRRGAR